MRSNGLEMSQVAPNSPQMRRSLSPDNAVSMITGMCRIASSCCSFRRAVIPSISGIVTSNNIRSGCCSLAVANPLMPVSACKTFQPRWDSSSTWTHCLMIASSSTIKTVLFDSTTTHPPRLIPPCTTPRTKRKMNV